MNTRQEDEKDVIRRFGWLDNERFICVTNEGIERIIDTSKKFKEEEFNVIPMYDSSIAKK